MTVKAAYYDPCLGFFGPLVVVVVITATKQENRQNNMKRKGGEEVGEADILFEKIVLSLDDDAERLF